MEISVHWNTKQSQNQNQYLAKNMTLCNTVKYYLSGLFLKLCFTHSLYGVLYMLPCSPKQMGAISCWPLLELWCKHGSTRMVSDKGFIQTLQVCPTRAISYLFVYLCTTRTLFVKLWLPSMTFIYEREDHTTSQSLEKDWGEGGGYYILLVCINPCKGFSELVFSTIPIVFFQRGDTFVIEFELATAFSFEYSCTSRYLQVMMRTDLMNWSQIYSSLSRNMASMVKFINVELVICHFKLHLLDHCSLQYPGSY